MACAKTYMLRRIDIYLSFGAYYNSEYVGTNIWILIYYLVRKIDYDILRFISALPVSKYLFIGTVS